jgi:hypothetical protein
VSVTPAEAQRAVDPARMEAILEEGVRIFTEITGLCVDQRAAIARNDTDRLLALGERAETLAARFHLLETAWSGFEGAGAFPQEQDEAGHAMPEPVRDASRRLAEAAATAALAASQSAELLARTSTATTAIRRVIEGAMSAGYLPNGEHRPVPRSVLLEKRA